MSEHMKTRTTGEFTEIIVTVPSTEARAISRAIESILAVARVGSQDGLETEDEALYTLEEVFPDSTPGRRLRGLRLKENLTQKQMAESLGVRQSHVSEMERGVRTITVDMAKRIAEKYKTAYKIFL